MRGVRQRPLSVTRCPVLVARPHRLILETGRAFECDPALLRISWALLNFCSVFADGQKPQNKLNEPTAEFSH